MASSIHILIEFLLITLPPAEQVSKRPGRYDEMPKSSTMDARHALLEQQFYATVQRQKTPALTPFSSGGYEVDTIEQLKRAVRSQVTLVCNTLQIFAHICKIISTDIWVESFPLKPINLIVLANQNLYVNRNLLFAVNFKVSSDSARSVLTRQ